MLVSERSPLGALQHPYPGLRAFEPHESFLFFGRETHTEELLRRLARNRFLAVVGSSGGGKSSLIRAGLVPALYRGHLVGSTSHWRIAIMRPGGAPIDAMATALAAPEVLGPEGDRARREALRATSLGLVQVVRGTRLEPRESLLLVVDQFEELFRFAGERREGDAGAEAGLFVSQLLQAAEQPEVSIYVVLTMRSDFLGDCAQFPGLPEALNRGQYLIPRLTREQRQQAIEGPLHLAGIGIRPPVVQTLLNEAGDDPDQLPVLQHALLRTFRRWQAAAAEGDVGFGHYEAAGGITQALNNHAQEICAALAESDRALTEKIFRCLTTTEAGRTVRRPARFARLCEVVGAAAASDKERASGIIRRFADPEHSLLLLSSRELGDDTVVDISHESLIRKWSALSEWAAQEAKSADWYRDLARDALRHRSGEGALYRDPDLRRTLQKRDEERWNPAWAARYWPAGDPSFEEINEFLRLSDKTQREDREREAARQRKELEDARRLAKAHKRVSTLTVLLLLTGVVAAAVIFYQDWKSKRDIAVKTREVLETQAALNQLQLRAASFDSMLVGTRRKLLTASEADRKRLEAQLEQLNKDRRDSQTEADRLRGQLVVLQNADALQTSDHGALLKRIEELQKQLAQATAERDDLKSQLADIDRTEQASQTENRLNAALRRISELERLAEPPLFVVLPQYSVVHLKQGALAERVALCLGDVARLKSSQSQIWVWTTSGKEPLPMPFRDDEKRARDVLAPLAKEGCKPDGASGRSCFVVQKEKTNMGEAQQLGSFLLGGVPYKLVATGWHLDSTGTDTISLAIYPAPRPPASAK